MESEEDLTVWCGNLPSQVDEELLYELFLQVAPLKRVHIPTDKSGKCMNYGFVTFKHQASVPFAIDMFNNIQLYDRSIIVRNRSANNQNNKSQQEALQMHPNENQRMGMSHSPNRPSPWAVPLMPMYMLPMIPQQHQQHDYHPKERSRQHGQHHNAKPYRHHSNYRNNSWNNNNRNHYRY